MKVKDVAKTYLRAFTGEGLLATNAQRELREFVSRLPAHQRSFVRAALETLASGKPPEPPTSATAMSWLAASPAAPARADAVLSNRNPPKTFIDLLARAYLAEFREVRDQTQFFVQTQITQVE